MVKPPAIPKLRTQQRTQSRGGKYVQLLFRTALSDTWASTKAIIVGESAILAFSIIYSLVSAAVEHISDPKKAGAMGLIKRVDWLQFGIILVLTGVSWLLLLVLYRLVVTPRKLWRAQSERLVQLENEIAYLKRESDDLGPYEAISYIISTETGRLYTRPQAGEKILEYAYGGRLKISGRRFDTDLVAFLSGFRRSTNRVSDYPVDIPIEDLSNGTFSIYGVPPTNALLIHELIPDSDPPKTRLVRVYFSPTIRKSELEGIFGRPRTDDGG